MHPTLPYLLSSSDDMLIKLWDWDKGWTCTQICRAPPRTMSCRVLATLLQASDACSHQTTACKWQQGD